MKEYKRLRILVSFQNFCKISILKKRLISFESKNINSQLNALEQLRCHFI